MEAVKIKLRSKYSHPRPGSGHKSTHNQSNPKKHFRQKHTFWTSPSNIGFQQFSGKLPPPQKPLTMIMYTINRSIKTKMVVQAA